MGNWFQIETLTVIMPLMNHNILPDMVDSQNLLTDIIVINMKWGGNMLKTTLYQFIAILAL